MPSDPNVAGAFEVYTMVLLRWPDPMPGFTEEELDALQARHLAYRAELRRQGVLVVNGPLGEQSDIRLRGLAMFACDLAEARRLTEGDPSVEAGRLTYELFEWWVAAGTLAFPRASRPIGKIRAAGER
jgi:uncharacterized protein YciI